MKIIFIADVPLDNPTSGSEQVLYQQATGLAHEDISVFAITRHAGSPLTVTSDIKGVRVGSYGASAENMLRSFIPVARTPAYFYRMFTKDTPFQAAVCHQPFNCFSLFITRKLSDVPFLYIFHSPSHEEYLLSYPKRNRLSIFLNVNLRRMIEKFCLKRAAKIMVLSRYMQDRIKEIHGIDANRIEINPGGVDLNRFRPPEDRKHLKHKLGFPEGKIHLLTVRNLEPRMGIANLLKCIRILKKGPDHIHLILGGEGVEKQNLERLIKEYGLLKNVTMAGFIPPEMLSEYYGAADLFVLPTRHLEGFGLVTPESMACGTPVLGTPVGGTKEILSGFNSRFLFRDTSPEAMAKGINGAVGEYFVRRKRYEQLRLDCREYVARNYSWERHTDKLRAMLDDEMHLLPIN